MITIRTLADPHGTRWGDVIDRSCQRLRVQRGAVLLLAIQEQAHTYAVYLVHRKQQNEQQVLKQLMFMFSIANEHYIHICMAFSTDCF